MSITQVPFITRRHWDWSVFIPLLWYLVVGCGSQEGPGYAEQVVSHWVTPQLHFWPGFIIGLSRRCVGLEFKLLVTRCLESFPPRILHPCVQTSQGELQA